MNVGDVRSYCFGSDYHFGKFIIRNEKLEFSTTPLIVSQRIPRRLARDWKEEYALRLQLMRVWQRGKCNNVLFEPRIGPVSHLDVRFQHQRLLSASVEEGMVAVCDPVTGRVNKDIVTLLPERGSHGITTINLSGNRVIAGLSDGRIGIVSHLKEGGSGVRQTLFDSMHHRGNVTALQTIASRDGSDKYILSGGEDGRILIWNAADGRCLKTLKGQGSVEAIIVDAKEGHVMATNAINQFLIWLCIDLTGEPAEAELSPSLVLPCPSSGPEPLYDSFSGLIFFTRNSKIICSDIRNGKTVAVLENAVGTITAWTWDSDCLLVEDRQGQVQERRLCVLVTGDSLGFVRVWDCRRVVEEYSRQCKLNQESIKFDTIKVQPAMTLAGHDHTITCVNLDAFKIVSASADGLIRIWDMLTGKCLRILSSRYFRYQHHEGRQRRSTPPQEPHVNEQSVRWSVRQLVMTLHQIVIAVGQQVKTWDMDPERQLERYRQAKKRNRASSRHRFSQTFGNSPKAQMKSELNRDLKESNRSLELEREDRNRLQTKYQISGLTEEEMLNYALTVSMDAAQPSSNNSHSYRSHIGFAHFTPVERAVPPPLHSEENYPPLSRSVPTTSALTIAFQEDKGPKSADTQPKTSSSWTRPVQSQPIEMKQDHHGNRSGTPSTKPPSYPKMHIGSHGTNRRHGFASPTTRPRKMSFGAFLASGEFDGGNESSASSTNAMAFPAATSISPFTSPLLAATALQRLPSAEEHFQLEPSAMNSVRQSRQQEPDPTYDTDAIEEGYDDDVDPYLSDLHDPRGLADGLSGGGFGSSHSGYSRRASSVRGQQWSSIQVVPRPNSRDEEEELQYVLELSLVEQ